MLATPENTIGLALFSLGYKQVFLIQKSNWNRYKFYGDELCTWMLGYWFWKGWITACKIPKAFS